MRINADLVYDDKDGELVRAYLEYRGLKHGPYLRAKLLQEAKDWKRTMDGGTQISVEALAGAQA